MAVVSCQTKTKVMPVDMTESEEAVTRVLDAHWSAVKAKDAEAVFVLTGLNRQELNFKLHQYCIYKLNQQNANT